MTGAEMSLLWPVWLASWIGGVFLFFAGARFTRAARRALDWHRMRFIDDLQSSLTAQTLAHDLLKNKVDSLESSRRDLAVELENLNLDKTNAGLALGQLEARRQRLADEADELRVRLAQAERQLEDAAGAEVERTLRHDLAVQASVAHGQKRELALMREALAELRMGNQELATLRPEIERLTAENRALTVRKHAAGETAARPAASPLHFAADARHRGASLQGMVDRISQLEGIRSAVLGDDLGLVVVSAGALDEELAAVGAMMVGAMSPARQMLPLQGVRRVTVEDDHDTRVTARRLLTGEEDLTSDLVLVTLTMGAEPPEARLIQAMEFIRQPSDQIGDRYEHHHQS